MKRTVPSMEQYISRRSPVMGRRGMVATNQPLATSAGLEALRSGGTAADAALAAAAVLYVTEPYSAGLGGDTFWIYYHAATGALHAANGSGRSAEALTLERGSAISEGGRLPERHPLTVTVPGAPAAWESLHDRFGRLTRGVLLSDAVAYAREGIPVEPITAQLWKQEGLPVLGTTLHGKQLLVRGGDGPDAGELVRNPELADCLELLSEEGAGPFYEGRIARRIVEEVQREGGILTLDDLAAHETEMVSPISVSYGGVDVHECPPNGQGLVALIALNVLKHSDYAELVEPGSFRQRAALYHRQIEATRIGFAAAAPYLGDPHFGERSLDYVLSEEFGERWGAEISKGRIALDGLGAAEAPDPGRDTVYFCTADQAGNLCSFISSVYMGFGSGIVPQECGYVLQNRGHGFVTAPGSRNALAPRKRANHTIIPGMMVRNRDRSGEAAAFGVMGGQAQPQGHLQVVTSMVNAGFDPQSALDNPRFYLADGRPDGAVLLEAPELARLEDELTEMGHRTRVVAGSDRAVFGLGQIIESRDSVYWSGSDPRGDGCALGY